MRVLSKALPVRLIEKMKRSGVDCLHRREHELKPTTRPYDINLHDFNGSDGASLRCLAVPQSSAPTRHK